MIPRSILLREDPCIGCPEKCSVYKEIAHVETREVKEDSLDHSNCNTIQEEKKEFVMNQVKESKEKPCIWMKAGVIAYRMCTSNYDCKNCEFDQALSDQAGSYGESPMIKQAIEKLRTMPADQRKCRYMLTGDISYKICPNNYECWHCPVDQMIQDLINANPLVVRKRAKKTEKPEKVRGFSFHPSVYYLPNHVWVKVDSDDQIKVGIDDFASKLLGEITNILSAKKGEELTEIKMQRNNRTLKIPIRSLGKIVKINEGAINNPQVLNQDPYNEGWLFTIKSDNILDNIKTLAKGDSAKRWLENDFERLQRVIQDECEITVADGGELVPDFTTKLPEKVVERLLKNLLNVEMEG
jgi:glycine cleavage system H lipoate-binding protein